jgi:hypothetical protein
MAQVVVEYVDGMRVESSAVPFPRVGGAAAQPHSGGGGSSSQSRRRTHGGGDDAAAAGSIFAGRALDADDMSTARHDYDDEVCDVCMGGQSCDGDELVCCEGCHTWVHQQCYGVDSVPDGDWCVHVLSTLSSLSCVLCASW